MNPIFFAAALLASQLINPTPFRAQFAATTSGKTVRVSIDGGRVQTEWAGKLGFRDDNHSWTSVCGAVRSPIYQGQIFRMKAYYGTSKLGGNIRKAGNIVAKYFASATTQAQCAGLQLAVWEAMEDGGKHADFGSGAFRSEADPETIAYAEEYYEAQDDPGNAIFLMADNNGQSQFSIQ